jgi:uncharacterized protein DUF3631
VELEERRWADYSHGKPLTKAKLARLLRSYGVVSRSVRLPDGRTPKGYLLEQFIALANAPAGGVALLGNLEQQVPKKDDLPF